MSHVKVAMIAAFAGATAGAAVGYAYPRLARTMPSLPRTEMGQLLAAGAAVAVAAGTLGYVGSKMLWSVG